jgi:hypothetical protein
MRRASDTLFILLLIAIALGMTALPVHAADLKVEARLIWGVNDEKPTVKCEPLDSALCDKLHRTFKWKNYYEITNKTAAIAVNHSSELKMSETCAIRVKNLGKSRVEVSCIGHGKEVHRGDYTLEPPQWLVLGGNGSGNTAWFVGLRAIDPKAVDLKKSTGKN